MDQRDREKLLLAGISVYDGNEDISAVIGWAQQVKTVMSYLSGTRKDKIMMLMAKVNGDAVTWLYQYIFKFLDEKDLKNDDNLSHLINDFTKTFFPANYSQIVINETADLVKSGNIWRLKKKEEMFENQVNFYNSGSLYSIN